MTRKYNYIYKLLVTDEKDVVGHVAYALYKMNKIEYIENFRMTHNKQPDDDDLKQFHDISCMSTTIENYRIKAVEIVNDFLEITLGETVSQIEHDSNERLKNIIEPMVQSKPKRFFSGVLQSTLGALFFALIVAAIFFIAKNNQNDDSVKTGQKIEQQIESWDADSL